MIPFPCSCVHSLECLFVCPFARVFVPSTSSLFLVQITNCVVFVFPRRFCHQTPSIKVLPLERETKSHTDTKQIQIYIWTWSIDFYPLFSIPFGSLLVGILGLSVPFSIRAFAERQTFIWVVRLSIFDEHWNDTLWSTSVRSPLHLAGNIFHVPLNSSLLHGSPTPLSIYTKVITDENMLLFLKRNRS
jgi:hypothetical protein